MPYIKQEKRDELRSGEFQDTYFLEAETSGELNYLFTITALKYLETKKLSYQTINDIVGALEGAKMEFYRRVAVPFEESKIRQNGDVYPL